MFILLSDRSLVLHRIVRFLLALLTNRRRALLAVLCIVSVFRQTVLVCDSSLYSDAQYLRGETAAHKFNNFHALLHLFRSIAIDPVYLIVGASSSLLLVLFVVPVAHQVFVPSTGVTQLPFRRWEYLGSTVDQVPCVAGLVL